MPKQLLTVLAGKFASARMDGLTTAVIRRFVARYGVNMQEAANPDIAGYASFNEFFTRSLREGARPQAEAGDEQRVELTDAHRREILALRGDEDRERARGQEQPLEEGRERIARDHPVEEEDAGGRLYRQEEGRQREHAERRVR